MPSKAQLKARADFVKNYAKKKKGSKSKAKVKIKKDSFMRRHEKNYADIKFRVDKSGKPVGASDKMMVKAMEGGFSVYDLPKGWFGWTQKQKERHLKKFIR